MMFHPLAVDATELTFVEARAHVAKLQAERALALRSELAANESYMTDLDAELAFCRQVYAVLAVTEIASLRAEVSGPQTG
jgi:hypothetical protein